MNARLNASSESCPTSGAIARALVSQMTLGAKPLGIDNVGKIEGPFWCRAETLHRMPLLAHRTVPTLRGCISLPEPLWHLIRATATAQPAYHECQQRMAFRRRQGRHQAEIISEPLVRTP